MLDWCQVPSTFFRWGYWNVWKYWPINYIIITEWCNTFSQSSLVSFFWSKSSVVALLWLNSNHCMILTAFWLSFILEHKVTKLASPHSTHMVAVCINNKIGNVHNTKLRSRGMYWYVYWLLFSVLFQYTDANTHWNYNDFLG